MSGARASGEPDPAFLRRSEEAFLASWPSVATSVDGTWLIRLAPGWPSNGRANAVTILDPRDDADAEARLDHAAETYARYGLPPTVRVTPSTPPRVVEVLERRGLGARKSSHVLVLDDPASLFAPFDGRITVDEAPREVWIAGVLGDAASTATSGVDARRETFRAMMRSCVQPTAFLRLAEGGTVASALSVTVHRDLFTVQNVVTAPRHRRRGLARALLGAAATWAGARGARRGFLFVEADNGPALALYARAGFRPSHGYHYRGPAAWSVPARDATAPGAPARGT